MVIGLIRAVNHFTGNFQGSNFSKMRVKKQFVRWYFLYLHFLASENLGPLSVVLILDINFLSSFLKCRSLTVNASENPVNGEVNIGYNLNAQSHTINFPAWSHLSQSYAF